MSTFPVHSRDFLNAKRTRQDRARNFRRRKDSAEYARMLEEASLFACMNRPARIAGKIEARAR